MESRIAHALLSLLLCLAFIHICRSQAVTVPYDTTGSCEVLNSTLCTAYGINSGDLIYVNNTATQSYQITVLQANLAQIVLLRSLGFNDCANALTEYACVGAFTPCYTVNTSSPAGVISLPALPCYSSCVNNVVAQCEPVFSALSQPLPPCPPPSLIYDLSALGGTSVTGNCTAFGSSSPNNAAVCPLSYVFFGKKRVTQIRVALIVFSYLCMVMLGLVIVLTALNPRVRKWPGPLILLMCGGQFILSFGISLLSWGSMPDLQCKGGFYRNVAKAQGFFIVTGIHVSVMTWLILTTLTTICIWSPNPATAMKLSYKWRYYLALLYLYPLAFIIYCCTDLGLVSVSILAATYSAAVEEKGLVYPLLALVCVGTLLWMASMAGVARAFRVGNGKADVLIYVRLLVYELIAIIPTMLFCVPFEVYRKDLTSLDSGTADPQTIKDSSWIVVACASVAAILCPFFFGSVFLFRSDHFKFVRAGLSTYSGASSHEGTTRSGSRRQQFEKATPDPDVTPSM